MKQVNVSNMLPILKQESCKLIAYRLMNYCFVEEEGLFSDPLGWSLTKK
jgi:hypothetical protein